MGIYSRHGAVGDGHCHSHVGCHRVTGGDRWRTRARRDAGAPSGPGGRCLVQSCQGVLGAAGIGWDIREPARPLSQLPRVAPGTVLRAGRAGTGGGQEAGGALCVSRSVPACDAQGLILPGNAHPLRVLPAARAEPRCPGVRAQARIRLHACCPHWAAAALAQCHTWSLST